MYATLGVPTVQVHRLFLRACVQQQPVSVHPAGTREARTWTGYLCVDAEGRPIISLAAEPDPSDDLQAGRLISGTFSVAGQAHYFRTTVREAPRPCDRAGCARLTVQLHVPSSLARVVPRRRLHVRLPDHRQVVGFFEPLCEINGRGKEAPRFEALLAGVLPGGLVALAPPGLLLDSETHYRVAWNCPRTDERRTVLVTVAHQHPRRLAGPRWLGLRYLPSDDITACRADLLSLAETCLDDAPAPTPAAQGPDGGEC